MTETENDTYRKGGVVAGLARQVEQLTRRMDQTASAKEVARLADVVAQLEAMLAQPKGEAEAVPTWLGLGADPEAAKQLLGDLVSWLDLIYLRYADAAKAMPECWLWHPEVVEELAWLMGAWHAAYGDTGSAREAGDWNDRLRPGVVRRIKESYAPTCSLDNHLPENAIAPRTVPFAEIADQIVDWWTTSRDQAGPTPTKDQLDDAAKEAARRTRRGGNQS